MIKNLIILVLGAIVWLTYFAPLESSEDQYCNIKTKEIRVIDQSGNVVKQEQEDQIICNDGLKNILHESGIADNCQYFTWKMPLANVLQEQRSIICKKISGGYEILPNPN